VVQNKNPYQSIKIRIIRVPILRFSEQSKAKRLSHNQKNYAPMWFKIKIRANPLKSASSAFQ
jgi:hypothetical protein